MFSLGNIKSWSHCKKARSDTLINNQKEVHKSTLKTKWSVKKDRKKVKKLFTNVRKKRYLVIWFLQWNKKKIKREEHKNCLRGKIVLMVLFLHYAQGKLVTEFWRIINRLTKMPYCLVVAVRVRTSVCSSALSDKSHFSVKTKASPCVGSLNTVYWILSLTVDRKILQFSFKLMLYRVVILLEGGQIRSGCGTGTTPVGKISVKVICIVYT